MFLKKPVQLAGAAGDGWCFNFLPSDPIVKPLWGNYVGSLETMGVDKMLGTSTNVSLVCCPHLFATARLLTHLSQEKS